MRPQTVVDETERVGDRLSVSSCQVRLHFNNGDEPQLEVVQGYSVQGFATPILPQG